METLNILEMVKRELNRRHITAADLSRKLDLSSSSANGMLHRNTMQVQRLAELSEICKYNFFREIADQLPYPEPGTPQPKPDDLLQKRITELEIELGVYRRMFQELVKK